MANKKGQSGTNPQGTCCVNDGPANKPGDCCPGIPLGTGNGEYCESVNGVRKCVTEKDYPYWCDAKPVIYLYPERRTKVDVELTVPGTIPVSNPQYPIGGWRDIEAQPDGTLTYKGNTYHELYYEAAIQPVRPPEKGIIIPARQLTSKLTELTTQLGLNKKEQEEFLTYWVGRLEEQKSPYMLISVFTPEQKRIIDQVAINPKPDTFIQFIMYYKPLKEPVSKEPLTLPSPPQRKGFTAVEWGGVVD